MAVKEIFSIIGSFQDTATLKKVDGFFCVTIDDGKVCRLSTDLFSTSNPNFNLKYFLEFGSLAALCQSLRKSGIKAYDFKGGDMISFTAEFASQKTLERVAESVQSSDLDKSLQDQVRKLAQEHNDLIGHLTDFSITSMRVGAAAEAPKTHNVNINQSGGTSMQAGDYATMAGGNITNETNHNNQVTNTGQQGGVSNQGKNEAIGAAAEVPPKKKKTDNMNMSQSGGTSMQAGDNAIMAGGNITNETNHNNQVTNTDQQGGVSIQGNGANFTKANITGGDSVTNNDPTTYNQGGQNYGSGNFSNSGTQQYGSK